MESTAKIYISNSYQGNLTFHRHRIPYTLYLCVSGFSFPTTGIQYGTGYPQMRGFRGEKNRRQKRLEISFAHQRKYRNRPIQRTNDKDHSGGISREAGRFSVPVAKSNRTICSSNKNFTRSGTK